MAWRRKQEEERRKKAGLPPVGTESKSNGKSAGTGKTVRVACPKCQTELAATPGGGDFACTQCGNEMRGLPSNFKVPEEVDAGDPSLRATGTHKVCCPNSTCGVALMLPDNGRPTKCPKCGQGFNAPKPGYSHFEDEQPAKAPAKKPEPVKAQRKQQTYRR